MVVVLVKVQDMLLRGSVPIQLADYVLPNQWNIITETVFRVHTDANFWSCCCEITLCILFAFPCIFCFHPCMSTAMIRSNLTGKLNDLNHTLFRDFPVLSLSDDSVMFNLDYLSTAEPIYLDRTNTFSEVALARTQSSVPFAKAQVKGPSTNEDQSGYVAFNPVASPARATAVRSFVVRVPPHAGPGSVLTVTAPNGNVLSVVVPDDSGPGLDIAIQY